MECIICLCDVSDNDYIMFECCKNYVHIHCITLWINTNKHDNKDIDKCISCKNENDVINNILYLNTNNNNIEYNNNYNNIDTSYIPILENRINNTTNNISINIPNNNQLYLNFLYEMSTNNCFKLLLLIFCIFISSCIIIICIYYTED